MRKSNLLRSSLVTLLPVLFLAGCAGPSEAPQALDEGSPETLVAARPDEREEAAEGSPVVVFLGDSLTAGYGLPESEAFPARLEEWLVAEGLPVKVINAGVSGDTSAGGLARLEWVLRQRPDVLVVELGANDGLRGLSLGATEENLRQIVQRARAAGARVLLVGMKIPPNYGPEYAESFQELYPRLAEELDVALVPFLLEGVGGEPGLNLDDGLHPNPEGHRIAAENVLPYLRDLVAETAAPERES